MSDAYRVELVTVDGGPTALGTAGTHSILADRPVGAGGRGLGFNGGQLLYLAIAACVSNDIYREAPAWSLSIRRVRVEVDGDFPAPGASSTSITVDVELDADGSDETLGAFIAAVDRVAEIPNTIRGTVPVTIRRAAAGSSE